MSEAGRTLVGYPPLHAANHCAGSTCGCSKTPGALGHHSIQSCPSLRMLGLAMVGSLGRSVSRWIFSSRDNRASSQQCAPYCWMSQGRQEQISELCLLEVERSRSFSASYVSSDNFVEHSAPIPPGMTPSTKLISMTAEGLGGNSRQVVQS
jgi:hypothetical protein